MKNDETSGYGGILITSVADIKDDNPLYKGPMVCAMRLFSGTSAFEATIPTLIIRYSFTDEKKNINLSARIGIGQNGKINEADRHPCRFLIAPIKK